jgi:glycosyltransferase involved in cell wall biosynthesis
LPLDVTAAPKAQTMKPPITACIITYNEERNIRDCLRSVEWADEVVVVDSYSKDRTVEIAREFTDKVVRREWNGINDQRRFAQDQAGHEWVFNLDADERASAELAREIASLDLESRDIDGYLVPRRAFYLGRWIKHGGWYPDYKLRLYRKAKGRFLDNDPHDTVELDGRTAKLRGEIEHYTYRDISDQLAQIQKFSTTRAEQFMHSGRKFSYLQLLFRPPWKFFNTYILRLGLLDGMAGFIISALSAYHVFVTWAKFWELTRKPEVKE